MSTGQEKGRRLKQPNTSCFLHTLTLKLEKYLLVKLHHVRCFVCTHAHNLEQFFIKITENI